jgi:YHS domain-containing protein
MEVEPEKAFATRTRGQTFYFCSADCVAKFDADPERYTAAVPSATTGIAEGTTGPVRVELPVRGLTRSGGAALAQGLRMRPA